MHKIISTLWSIVTLSLWLNLVGCNKAAPLPTAPNTPPFQNLCEQQVDSLFQLYGSPQVSLLTCSASDSEPFYMYGHSAIRVRTAQQDVVYNYGTFSFNQPHFLWNFMTGNPRYMLAVQEFEVFIWAYQMDGRGVQEQTLNLSPRQTLTLCWQLMQQASPEYREYYYNFYFNNCATKPRDLILKYANTKELDNLCKQTFRDAIRHAHGRNHWYSMGCDLCLGWESDAPMTKWQAAFLPDSLHSLVATAHTPNGHPFMKKEETLLTATAPQKDFGPLTPNVVFSLFFIVYAGLCYGKRYAQKKVRLIKVTHATLRTSLYLGCFIAGCILWFLAFVSHHPHTLGNLNLLLFHPFYLLLLLSTLVRGNKKWSMWLYFINFACVVIYIVLTAIGVQKAPEGIEWIAFALLADLVAIWSSKLFPKQL